MRPFYVIIAGSRSFDDYDLLKAKMDALVANKGEVVVVSGCARGADQLVERWAAERGFEVHRFPADWSRYGQQAGFLRNARMSDYADAVVAFRVKGVSRGTDRMIKLARHKGLPLRVIHCA